MVIRWFLFETWLGDKLLCLFERFTGLAVVELGELAWLRDAEAELVALRSAVAADVSY